MEIDFVCDKKITMITPSTDELDEKIDETVEDDNPLNVYRLHAQKHLLYRIFLMN